MFCAFHLFIHSIFKSIDQISSRRLLSWIQFQKFQSLDQGIHVVLNVFSKKNPENKHKINLDPTQNFIFH